MKINLPIFNNIYSNRLNSCALAIPKYGKELQKDTFQKNEISFGASCSPANFKIKTLKNIRCPICGQITIDDAQANRIAEELASKKGEELIEAFEKYEDESNVTDSKSKCTPRHNSIFTPHSQKIINMLKRTALDHPKYCLLKLVQTQAKYSLGNLINEQMKIVQEYRKFIASSRVSKKQKVKLYQIVNKYTEQILGKSEETFSRKRFLHDSMDATDDEHMKKGIEKVLSKLPRSIDSTDSFFVKYSHNRSSKEIAMRLLEGSIASTEHLLPKSEGGADDTKNYIVDHRDCNSRRQSTSLNAWLSSKPKVTQELQEYLNFVQAEINKGNLNGIYTNYVPEVIETIKNLSKGKIKLNPPSEETLILNMPEQRKRLIESKWKKVNALEHKIESIEEQIAALKYLEDDENFEYLKDQSIIRILTTRQTHLIGARKIKNDMDSYNAEIAKKEDIEQELKELKQKFEIKKAQKKNTGYTRQMIDECNKRLKDIYWQEQIVKKLKEALEKIFGIDDINSIDEMESENNALIEKYYQIQDYMSLIASKDRLKYINTHNRLILESVQNFKEMSDEEFNAKINQIINIR